MNTRHSILKRKQNAAEKHKSFNHPRNQQLIRLGLQESILVKYINIKIDNLGNLSVDRILFRTSNNNIFLVVIKFGS